MAKQLTWRHAHNKAKELGATQIIWVINWCWAKNFPSPEKGREFVLWCNDNGIDNRGYCEAMTDSTNPNLRVDGVRFR